MVVALSFTQSELKSVKAMLSLCAMRGEHHDASCVVISDDLIDSDEVSKYAARIFSKVSVIRHESRTVDRLAFSWTNSMWQEVARKMHMSSTREPWAWIDGKTVPVRSDWVEQLDTAYANHRSPFLIRPDSGVGVYPPNVSGMAPNSMLRMGRIFTASIPQSLQKDPNGLIQSDIDFSNPKISDTSILYRGDDASWVTQFLITKAPPRITKVTSKTNPLFRHSGSTGDIIYALASIKAKGGGRLALTMSDLPRTRMTEDHFRSLEPLIASQPYISSVYHQLVGPYDYDLDSFRDGLRNGYEYGRTILDYTSKVAHASVDDSPWITVDHKLKVPDRPVVINRTMRYRNHRFPWQEVANKYREQTFFLGSKEEFELMKFQYDWPELIWVKTKHYLEVARLIAGASLFIGNQSSLYALAEGMKHPSCILEVFLLQPDCLFHRPGVTHGWDENILLPDL